MRFFAVALIFFGVTASLAQAPEVPHKMHFANLTLTIRDEARREIQRDVDALTRHPKYFNVKAERAKTYFPIISKIFAEEEVPDDLKYLVLQESALVADAVSVSNAVGFWQFKDFTAISVGLRVDGQIDERMNIASASRGAAKYLKQNNQQFDNWIMALQAYQMGAGGVKRSVGDKHNGKRHFEVTADTYWYIKKFIAHKVAFENEVHGEPQVKAVFIDSRGRKTISEVASEMALEESVLKEYNKWALGRSIPDDKSYMIVVPNGKISDEFPTNILSSNKASKAKPLASKSGRIVPEIKLINGLRAIKALEDESLVALSGRAGITLARFLKFNEMNIDRTLEPGEFYFLDKKKMRSFEFQHKVKLGDDLWSISQLYGLQLRKLKKWNGTLSDERLTVGSVVQLSSLAVSLQTPLPTVSNEKIASLEEETFNWDVKSVQSALPTKDSVVQSSAPLAESSLPLVENQVSKEHIVMKGETLYSIAKMHEVSVMSLANWNTLVLTDGLRVGQKIVLYSSKDREKVHVSDPAGVVAFKDAQLTHEVRPSDTLYAIARRYGVTIKDLMDWNDKKELSLKEGEKIKILKK